MTCRNALFPRIGFDLDEKGLGAIGRGWRHHRRTVVVSIALLMSGFVHAYGAARQTRQVPKCSTWLSQTLKRIEKRPEQAWRSEVVSSLAQSCSAIPEPLRKAASEIRRIKDPASREKVLAAAAQSVLGAACSIADPLANSRQLASSCPLPDREEFHLHDVVLGDIRAVDYALLNAIARSLVDAGEYDATAQRVLMDFTLSSALQGEQARSGQRGAEGRGK